MQEYHIPVYSEYILRGYWGLLGETGEAERLLVQLAQELPGFIVKMMLDRRFGELSIQAGLKFDLVSDLGFKNSLYSETLMLNRDMYIYYWDRISARLNYVESDSTFYANQKIYQQET